MPRAKNTPLRVNEREAKAESFVLVVGGPSNQSNGASDQVDNEKCPCDPDFSEEDVVETGEPVPVSFAHLSSSTSELQTYLANSSFYVMLSIFSGENERELNLPGHLGNLDLSINPLESDLTAVAKYLFTPPPKNAWLYVSEEPNRSLLYFEWSEKPLTEGKTQSKTSKSKNKSQRQSSVKQDKVFRMFPVQGNLPVEVLDGLCSISRILHLFERLL